MKFKSFFLLMAILLVSCQDDDKRMEAQRKDAEIKLQIFNTVNNGWRFTAPSLNPNTQAVTREWLELQQLLNELNQKPQSSIGAFQRKAKTLSKKGAELSNGIPLQFNKPEIKSRISSLTTKFNSIDLFINLDAIPAQKVVANIIDANAELQSLFSQMDEIIRKREIPKEQGESDLIQMLDNSRAIPTPQATTSSPKKQ